MAVVGETALATRSGRFPSVTVIVVQVFLLVVKLDFSGYAAPL